MPGQAPRRPGGRGNQPGAGQAVRAGTHRLAACSGTRGPAKSIVTSIVMIIPGAEPDVAAEMVPYQGSAPNA